jgi:hypothetical protein
MEGVATVFSSLNRDQKMRTTVRLFAAACLLTATLGCQPEADPNVSTDVNVDLGESTPAQVDTVHSNTTAVGELPHSNVTGTAELPAQTETPEVTDTPAVEETPAVTEVPATEPAVQQDSAEPTDATAPELVD